MIHFYTANLTLRTVRAGHARPAGLPLHPVHLNPVGEGFIPPAYPTQPPTKRIIRRGGIHAARAPCLYHQPNPPPPCRGRACPARNLSYTTTCGHRAANPQHAPCPKITLKICGKLSSEMTPPHAENFIPSAAHSAAMRSVGRCQPKRRRG